MLYIDPFTRETYTAHQSLFNEEINVIPIRLPRFTSSQLDEMCKLPFSQISSNILNLFFGVRISSSDVDRCLKANPLIPDYLDRKTLLIKLVCNEDRGIRSLTNDIYNTLTHKPVCNALWARIAIFISLLFGVYADIHRCGIVRFDVSATNNGPVDLIAYYFAREMGLPLGKIILGSNEEDELSALIRFGEVRSSYNPSIGFILYAFDSIEVSRYIQSCKDKTAFLLSDEHRFVLNDIVFSTVVSAERSRGLVYNICSTFNKAVNSTVATAYGALQDYRSITGENHTTLILSEEY